MPVNLRNRDFATLTDFSPDEIRFLLQMARDLKAAKYGRYANDPWIELAIPSILDPGIPHGASSPYNAGTAAWWQNVTAWLTQTDADWCYWHLGGTHVKGTEPVTNRLIYSKDGSWLRPVNDRFQSTSAATNH